MSSIFEKVVKDAKRSDRTRVPKTKNAAGPEPTDNNTSLKDSSGLFRILSFASVKPTTMERNKIIPAIQDRAAITAYKVLRTRVLQRMRSHKWRNLIVTGAGPGEGKTLTACNLALSISNDVNQSVFLVDLDLQRPSVARYFGLDVTAGIGDYLKGDAKIEDIVYAPNDLDRIAIIPNREPVENASDLLASPKMRDLLRWLKSQGGAPIAIFDMPPVLSCDDVLVLYPSVDALLMVASEGVTQRDSLSRALELLTDCNLLGVVLNRSREHQKVSPYY
jgi:Mrp family chromosome partitioning ATPase